MPHILITGNGFDLHHHLPTWYDDFMKVMKHIEQNNELDFDSVYKNVKNYKTLKSIFKNELKIQPEILEKITTITGKNLLYKYFLQELEIDTWIDFESKLQYLLSCIYNSIKLLRVNIFDKGYLERGNWIPITKVLSGKIEYAIILKMLGIADTDYELIIFEEKFLIKKENFNIDINEQKILDLVFSQLMEFKELFHLYLQNFVMPLVNSDKHFKDKIDFYNQFRYHFTFNYTLTAEIIYGANKDKIFYLHGKSGQDSENIVFGINSLFNIEEKMNEYLLFTKYYQKYANRTDFHFLNNIEYKSNEEYYFYFWGHSLDSSDAYYINQIFDFYTNHKAKGKIVVIFHNENSYKRLLRNLFFIRGQEDIEDRLQKKSLVFETLDSPELKTLVGTRTYYNLGPSFF